MGATLNLRTVSVAFSGPLGIGIHRLNRDDTKGRLIVLEFLQRSRFKRFLASFPGRGTWWDWLSSAPLAFWSVSLSELKS